MYAGGISKRSSRSLWSRKSPFRCPLCHQAIPFEIRRRRELCYLRVWADQRQIPGWDAYVRNWYAWWGFPSRIVNYHNLVAGRGQSLAMPIPYRHACCIRFAQGEGGRYQFDFATRKETTAVCLRVRCVARTPSWPPLLDSKCIPLLVVARLSLSISGHAIHWRAINPSSWLHDSWGGEREGGERSHCRYRMRWSWFSAFATDAFNSPLNHRDVAACASATEPSTVLHRVRARSWCARDKERRERVSGLKWSRDAMLENSLLDLCLRR